MYVLRRKRNRWRDKRVDYTGVRVNEEMVVLGKSARSEKVLGWQIVPETKE